MKILKKFEQYLKEDLDSNEVDEISTEDIEAASDKYDDLKGTTEEEDDYIGDQLIEELALALGTKVENNQVNYNGKKINFYSETEKFHVDKKKFSTVEEVVNYLTGSQVKESFSRKRR